MIRATTMQESRRAISPELNSRQVLFRILFRLVLLIAFATFGSQGFGQTFNALLALTAVFCIVAGAMRREFSSMSLGPSSDRHSPTQLHTPAPDSSRHSLVILRSKQSATFIPRL